MEWYLAGLKNYVGFSGRAGRKEFWMFFLFNVVISVCLAALGNILGTGFLGPAYTLAALLPSVAVAIRRLHDTNRSGWWLLIGVVPLIGVIVLVVFLAAEGGSGDNQYGVDPKLNPVLL